MATIKFEEVLKGDLSKSIVRKYTVIDFCKKAGIERGSFYQRYGNICDLFASVMVLQARRTLRGLEKESIEAMIFRMLEKVKANKYYFLNIILISKDSRVFYDVLRKEIALAIENYMRPRGAFSVRQVELVANGIYAITYYWILNECKHDIRDVYQCIGLLLKNINKTKKVSLSSHLN
ncbi:TetR/AcrR family transcriptional regulator [Lactobacillus apis]|uniref:TetR/AcrR family transcriptional regulator n=1 Tax=Lactobacillus apis TaxID=303541 RepID=UPI00242E6597|nr:hypothetical protein [Lactobacillus apis]